MSGRRFTRRHFAKLTGVAATMLLAQAHTPYGQWTVYRQRNLFIVASRLDPDAVALARSLAEGFVTELPEARARMTRATDPVRIASLLATGQLDVAVVSRQEAAAMEAGADEYRAVGPVPLRALAELGGHLLVALESFRARHAWILAASVDHLRERLPVSAMTAGDGVPPLAEHAGAAAYRSGEPLPEVEEP